LASSPFARGVESVTTGMNVTTEMSAGAVPAAVITIRAIQIEIAGPATAIMAAGTRVVNAVVIEGTAAVMLMTRDTAVAIRGTVAAMRRKVVIRSMAIVGVVMSVSEGVAGTRRDKAMVAGIKGTATESQVPLAKMSVMAAEMIEGMATPAIATRGMVAEIRVAAVATGIVAIRSVTVTMIEGTTATTRKSSPLRWFPSRGLLRETNGRGHALLRRPPWHKLPHKRRQRRR